ncbi:MAG: NPCBM/NEW2 domain-containing protein [Pirellulales bacterium]
MTSLVLFVSLLAGADPPPTAQTEFEVRALDGRAVAGSLAELTSERVSVVSPQGKVSLVAKDLLDLAPKTKPAPPSAKPGAWIELVDGSSLVAVDYVAEKDRARIALVGGESLAVPTAAVASVRFRPPGPDAARWSEILKANTPGDHLVVRRGEALDDMVGVLKDVDAKSVRFELDGEVIPVPRAKVEGLVYYHPPGKELPAAACQVTDAAGSRLQAKAVTLADGRLRIVLRAGFEVARPLSDVARVDFSLGKVQYLGDLEPESVQWTPAIGLAKNLPSLERLYRPRPDRGLEGEPLVLGGKAYAKGLAIHSRTKLVYRLAGKYSRLAALVGIDDRMGKQGDVRLVISGDKGELFNETVKGNDAPRSLNLDLAGVTRLTILVDFGADLDVADHLDLCEARLLP